MAFVLVSVGVLICVVGLVLHAQQPSGAEAFASGLERIASMLDDSGGGCPSENRTKVTSLILKLNKYPEDDISKGFELCESKRSLTDNESNNTKLIAATVLFSTFRFDIPAARNDISDVSWISPFVEVEEEGKWKVGATSPWRLQPDGWELEPYELRWGPGAYLVDLSDCYARFRSLFPLRREANPLQHPAHPVH